MPPPLLLEVLRRVRVDVRLRCREVCRSWRDALDDPAAWRKLDFAHTCQMNPYAPAVVPAPAPRLAAAVARRAWPAELSAGWQRLLQALALNSAAVAEDGPHLTENDTQLLAAAARADGKVVGISMPRPGTPAALHAVVSANPGMELLYLNSLPLSMPQCAELLRLAPQAQLSLLIVRLGKLHWGTPPFPPAQPGDSEAIMADAARLLRREPPFERVHARELMMHFMPDAQPLEEATVLQFAHDLAEYGGGLLGVNFWYFRFPSQRAFEAVVDALVQAKITQVTLMSCTLGVQHIPGLARLLGSPALTALRIWNFGVMLLENDLMFGMGMMAGAGWGATEYVSTTTLLCNALRANRTLKCLELQSCGLTQSVRAFESLLRALKGHPSVASLNFACNVAQPQNLRDIATTISPALYQLVSGNTQLESLQLAGCCLGDLPFEAIVNALQYNTTLKFVGAAYNQLSVERFMCGHLMPFFVRRRLSGVPIAFDVDEQVEPKDIAMRWMKDIAHCR